MFQENSVMYKPKYYTISELVHPDILKSIGEHNCWLRLDGDVLKDLDCIREEWSKYVDVPGIYINRLDLNLDSRGLRPPHDPDGAEFSTHKQGTTFDLEPVSGVHHVPMLWRMVHQMIKRGKLKRVNTMEALTFTPTWVHIGYMNHNIKPLIIRP